MCSWEAGNANFVDTAQDKVSNKVATYTQENVLHMTVMFLSHVPVDNVHIVKQILSLESNCMFH